MCAEAYASRGGFANAVRLREQFKNDAYLKECEKAGLEFYPFVLGGHGGFGPAAKEVWGKLAARARAIQGRDWRHSWSAMSYSAVWLQKLSIAIANQTAIATQRRMHLCSRERVLGALGGGGGDESGEVYESVAEARGVSGVER